MRERGTTLLELLVVLVLFGVLSCLALPVAHQLGPWPLKTAAREVASAMREARETAITHGQTCSLVFYDIGGRYRLDLPNGTTWTQWPDGVWVSANNFRYVAGRPTIAFRFTGAPNSGGHLALTDKRGKKLYVIVTPVTGRVRISDTAP